MSQEGKGSRVPTPRHLMFVFRERGLQKKISTECYGFQKKKNTFVSKSVAVTYLPNNELLMDFKKGVLYI